MSDHNDYPFPTEQRRNAHAEHVQFNDGEVALGYFVRGDNLTLGFNSELEYASNFYFSDMALVTTRSGNSYGLTQGLIINQGKQVAHQLPIEDLQVTIGEPLIIPGIAITSEVENVLLRWKVAAPNTYARQVDAPNPFGALNAQAEAAHAANPGFIR